MLSAEDYFLRYVSILCLKRISQGRFLEKNSCPFWLHNTNLPLSISLREDIQGKNKNEKNKKTCK